MEKFDHYFIQPRDWQKSFLFYTEILGWEVKSRFGDAADASRFAKLSYGEFVLFLAEDHDLTPAHNKPQIFLTKLA